MRSPTSGTGSPATRAATTRPRAKRSVSSNGGAPLRRGDDANPPHPAATGHSPQRGARGRQTVAPSSIIAWLNSAALRAGSSPSTRARNAFGVSAPSRRSSTRRTFVSIAASCRSHANDATAAAVYGPTPGSSVRSSGQPLVATTRAAACSASARRL